SAIHTDLVVARQRSGQQRFEQIDSPKRQQYAQSAANQTERETFNHYLPHDPPATRAETRADGQFTLPRRRPRQHQIRDVDAGHQQHERDRAEQYVKRLARIARQLFVRRPDQPAQTFVLREPFFYAAGDGARVFLRLRDRHAGFEPSHENNEVIVARVHAVAGGKGDGRPQFDLGQVVEERQSPRHHAGDGETFAAEFDLAPDDRAVAAEAAPPQTVTEQYDAMPSELIFFRRE